MENDQDPFIAQLTEHCTFEMELRARDSQKAAEQAEAMVRQNGLSSFTLVERDRSNCVVAAWANEARGEGATMDTAPAQSPRPKPSARVMTSDQLAIMVQLLVEVKESTLSQQTFEQAKHILSLINPPS